MAVVISVPTTGHVALTVPAASPSAVFMWRVMLCLSVWAIVATAIAVHLLFLNHRGGATANLRVRNISTVSLSDGLHVPEAAPPGKTPALPLRTLAKNGVLPQVLSHQPTPPVNCRPGTRYAYVKTHKTGSSTMTNIFHRYAVGHNLTLALPKDNLFYGWPHARSSAAISGSVEHVGGLKPPYDVLCSGHLIYDRNGIEQVVPGAQYITSLRDPISHFVSSWNHWHVGDHIIEGGGPKNIDIRTFATNPEKFLNMGRFSDRLLVQNSMAFDLGLRAPKLDQVERLIMEMDKHFPIVVITDHMVESLVVMKHVLCWTLDDVTYLSLKVSSETYHKKTVLDPATSASINKMNWADRLLFDHFNRSMWMKLNEMPDGFQQVTELKRRLASFSSSCGTIIRPNQDEDHHRVRLEEVPNLTPLERSCREAALDSKGFSKHIKKLMGYPVEKLECWAVRPHHNIVIQRLHNPQDDILVSILAQMSVQEHFIEIALPTLDYLKVGEPQDWFVDPTTFLSQSSAHVGMLALPGLRYHRSVGDALVKNPHFLAVMRNPVDEFLDAWDRWVTNNDELTGQAKMTLDTFLETPIEATALLPLKVQRRLFNRISYRMGVDGPNDHAELQIARGHLGGWFALVMIAEYPEESLVLLRRTECWSLSDVAWVDVAKWRSSIRSEAEIATYSSKWDVSELKNRIHNVNRLDHGLYTAINQSFWRRIEGQVSFQEERKLVVRHLQKAASICATITESDNKADMDRCAFRSIGGNQALQKWSEMSQNTRQQRKIPL